MSAPEQTPSPTRQPARDTDDDAPMTLEEACRVIFAGAIKPATLLAEARRGKLVMERVGRRNFVTRAGIKAMREACRVQPPTPPPPPAKRPELLGGYTHAEISSRALDIALESLRKFRKPNRRSRKVGAPSEE